MTLEDKKLREMKTDLDDFLPRGKKVEAVMTPEADSIAGFDKETQAVKEGLRPETANTIAELDILSFGGVSADIESVEAVRAQVKTELHLATQAGNPKDILEITSSLLGVDAENLSLAQIDERATFRLTAPVGSFAAAFGNRNRAIRLLQKITASTYAMNLLESGSLKYQTPTEFNNGGTSDPGYSDTQPDSGGTYSAVYQTPE